MSYIPDCRRDDNYNQKFLNEKNKEFLSGFDWAIENTVDNFFDNMDMCDDSYMDHFLNEPVPEFLRSEYTMEFAFGREDEDRKVKTYGDLLRYKLLEWVEANRNELITSMLDDQEE